jgi:hypothetical protein
MTFPFHIPPGKLLFHPCCGNDIGTPLDQFIDQVDVFIFVDALRLPRWSAEHGGQRQDSRTLLWKLGFRSTSNEVFGDRQLKPQILFTVAPDNGEPMLDPFALEAQSCIVKSTFTSMDGRTITIVRKRGCGLTTLQDIEKLDVFYYSGDSSGEGGSNLPLMRQPDLYWLPKMTEPGKVVTDGSNCSRTGLGRWLNTPEEDEETYSGETFSGWGRKFTCHRKIGYRNGPVLEWNIDMEYL